MSSSILGIDFGTTNTAACFYDRQGKLRPVVVKDRVYTLPSVVWFRGPDNPVVGHTARMQIADQPLTTIHGARRFLGRRFRSEFVRQYRERFAYSLVEGPGGETAVEVHGQTVALVEVARLIIGQILNHANQTAGERFTECVLAIPTHAGLRQRQAVRMAAEKAGLRVRALVNEPTAVALHYANLRTPDQVVLVCDLGGSTCDATLLCARNRTVQVTAAGGDQFLGGADFDWAIVEALMWEFESKERVDLRSSSGAIQRLLLATEGAKIALSTQEEVQLRVPCVAERDGRFLDFDFRLRREQVEGVVAHLVERVAGICGDVLARAGMEVGAVSELVLVGGQARMPAIRRRFSDYRRCATDTEPTSELAVAIGAAVLGRNLGRGAPVLQDTVMRTLCARLPSGRVHDVVTAGTPVPASGRFPLEDLPESGPVSVVLMEALDEEGFEREAVGEISVPPEWRRAQRGTPQVELQVGQDCTLAARLISASGAANGVKITEPTGGGDDGGGLGFL